MGKDIPFVQEAICPSALKVEGECSHFLVLIILFQRFTLATCLEIGELDSALLDDSQ